MRTEIYHTGSDEADIAAKQGLILRAPPRAGVSKPHPEEPAAGGRLEASS
jgi:hypothetical protein